MDDAGTTAEASPPGEMFFCQLVRQPLEEALKKLLLRSLQKGWHALVVVPDPERLGLINEELWSIPHEWILPHGVGDGLYADKLPIFLSSALEAPNNPEVVFLCQGAWLDWPTDSSTQQPGGLMPRRVCLMLEATQLHDHTQHARALWQACPAEARRHIRM